uniref:Uncharacterized protein n=1 Tax=Glossina brevipalpis TaxID=37001 RepID=A0A1A9WER9_9MUSC
MIVRGSLVVAFLISSLLFTVVWFPIILFTLCSHFCTRFSYGDQKMSQRKPFYIVFTDLTYEEIHPPYCLWGLNDFLNTKTRNLNDFVKH